MISPLSVTNMLRVSKMIFVFSWHQTSPLVTGILRELVFSYLELFHSYGFMFSVYLLVSSFDCFLGSFTSVLLSSFVFRSLSNLLWLHLAFVWKFIHLVITFRRKSFDRYLRHRFNVSLVLTACTSFPYYFKIRLIFNNWAETKKYSTMNIINQLFLFNKIK